MDDRMYTVHVWWLYCCLSYSGAGESVGYYILLVDLLFHVKVNVWRHRRRSSCTTVSKIKGNVWYYRRKHFEIDGGPEIYFHQNDSFSSVSARMQYEKVYLIMYCIIHIWVVSQEVFWNKYKSLHDPWKMQL